MQNKMLALCQTEEHRKIQGRNRVEPEPESNKAEASGPFPGWVLCLPVEVLPCQVQWSLLVQNQNWAWS